MIAAWFAAIDVGMAERLPPDQLAAMKVRERITALVEARLELLAPNREALRRALAILAMPQNAATRRRARLARGRRDVARSPAIPRPTTTITPSARILSGVYAATIAVFLEDESEGWADTRAFLGRRIDGIMRFEKAKARVLGRGQPPA